MDAVLESAAKQTHRRLHDEAGIHATEAEVRAWTLEQMQQATHWMDALLRRKEGVPHSGDTYTFPPHVKAVVQREA